MTPTPAPSDTAEFTILIPAFKPSPDLLPLLHTLSPQTPDLVLVDDGSGPDFAPLFEQARSVSNLTLLRHDVNRGKGAALKTGLAHILETHPRRVGVITADADGQHLPVDILRVAAELQQHPTSLVLGAREFAGTVPFRSRLGNIATRNLLSVLAGIRLTDTQTGLRGIPTAMIPRLLKLRTERYEFELDMLLRARLAKTAIRQIPIQTVYLNNNASSHFNPLVDSARIYSVLLRYPLTSAAATVAAWFGAGSEHAELAGAP